MMAAMSLGMASRITLAAAALLVVIACGGNGNENTSPGGTDAAGQRDIFSASAPDDPLGDWRPKYDEIAEPLDLTDPEREHLTEAFLERDRVLRAWLESPDGQRLLRLESELSDAVGGRDLGRVNAITSEAGPLRRHFEGLVESTEQEVLASLSPERRQEWDAHRLYSRLADQMEPLGLSDDQHARLLDRAFRFLRRAYEEGEPNPEAAAFLEYERWAELSVLDPDQRARYEGVKRANPLRSLQR